MKTTKYIFERSIMLFFILLSSWLSAQSTNVNLLSADNSIIIGQNSLSYELVLTDPMSGMYSLSTNVDGLYFAEAPTSNSPEVSDIILDENHRTFSFLINDNVTGQIPLMFDIKAGHAFRFSSNTSGVIINESVTGIFDLTKDEVSTSLVASNSITVQSTGGGIAITQLAPVDGDYIEYTGDDWKNVERKYKLLNEGLSSPISGFLFFKDEVAPSLKVTRVELIQDGNVVDFRDVSNQSELKDGIVFEVRGFSNNSQLTIVEKLEILGGCIDFPVNNIERNTSVINISWGVFYYDRGEVLDAIQSTGYNFEGAAKIIVSKSENIDDNDYRCLANETNKRFSITFKNVGTSPSYNSDIVHLDGARSPRNKIFLYKTSIVDGDSVIKKYRPAFNNDIIRNPEDPFDEDFLVDNYETKYTFDSPVLNPQIPDEPFANNAGVLFEELLSHSSIQSVASVAPFKENVLTIDRDKKLNRYGRGGAGFIYLPNPEVSVDDIYATKLFIDSLVSVDFPREVISTVLLPNETLKIEWEEQRFCVNTNSFREFSDARTSNFYRYYKGNCNKASSNGGGRTTRSIGASLSSPTSSEVFSLAADVDFCSETSDGLTDLYEMPIGLALVGGRAKKEEVGNLVFQFDLEAGIDLDRSFETLVNGDEDGIPAINGPSSLGTDVSGCESGSCFNCATFLAPSLNNMTNRFQNFEIFFRDEDGTKYDVTEMLENDLRADFSVETGEIYEFNTPESRSTGISENGNIRYRLRVPIQTLLEDFLFPIIGEEIPENFFLNRHVAFVNRLTLHFRVRSYCTKSNEFPRGTVSYFYNSCEDPEDRCGEYPINFYSFETRNNCPGCTTPGTNISQTKILRLDRGFEDQDGNRLPDHVNNDGILNDEDRVPEGDDRLTVFTTSDKIRSSFTITISNGEPYNLATKNSITFADLETRSVDLDNIYLNHSQGIDAYKHLESRVKKVIMNDKTELNLKNDIIYATSTTANTFRLSASTLGLDNFHNVRSVEVEQDFEVVFQPKKTGSQIKSLLVDNIKASLSPCDDCIGEKVDLLADIQAIASSFSLEEANLQENNSFYFCTNDVFTNTHLSFIFSTSVFTGGSIDACTHKLIRRSGMSNGMSFVDSFEKEFREFAPKDYDFTTVIPRGYDVSSVRMENNSYYFNEDGVGVNTNNDVNLPLELLTDNIGSLGTDANEFYDKFFTLNIPSSMFQISDQVLVNNNATVIYDPMTMNTIDDFFKEIKMNHGDEQYRLTFTIGLVPNGDCRTVLEEIPFDNTTLPSNFPSTSLPAEQEVSRGQLSFHQNLGYINDPNLYVNTVYPKENLFPTKANVFVQAKAQLVVIPSVSTSVLFEENIEEVRMRVLYPSTEEQDVSAANVFLEFDLSKLLDFEIESVRLVGSNIDYPLVKDELTNKYYVLTGRRLTRTNSFEIIAKVSINSDPLSGGCNPYEGCTPIETSSCPSNVSMVVHAGWNCDPLTDVVALQEACNFDVTNKEASADFNVSTSAVGVNVSQSLSRDNETTNKITTCDDLFLDVVINSCRNGTVSKVQGEIVLPEGVMIDGIPIIINRVDESNLVITFIDGVFSVEKIVDEEAQPLIVLNNPDESELALRFKLVSTCDLPIMDRSSIETSLTITSYNGSEEEDVMAVGLDNVLLINRVNATDDFSLETNCLNEDGLTTVFSIINNRDFETQATNTAVIDLPLSQIENVTGLPSGTILDEGNETLTFTLPKLEANETFEFTVTYDAKSTVSQGDQIEFTLNVNSIPDDICGEKGLSTCAEPKSFSQSCSNLLPPPAVTVILDLDEAYCQNSGEINLYDFVTITAELELDKTEGVFFVNTIENKSGLLATSISGDYTIVYEFINEGNTLTSTDNTTIISAPVISAGDEQSVCDGEEYLLEASGQLTNSSVQWFLGDQQIANTVTTMLTNEVGIYNYELIVTNSTTSCSSTDQVEVTVNELPQEPTVTLSSATSCHPNNIGELTTNFEIQNSYKEGEVLTVNPPTIIDRIITETCENDVCTRVESGILTQTSIYSFAVEDPSTGCITNSSQEIIVSPELELEIDMPDLICQRTDVNIGSIINGGEAPYNVTWTSLRSNGTVLRTLNGDETTEIPIRFNSAGNRELILDVADENGCVVQTESVLDIQECCRYSLEDVTVDCNNGSEFCVPLVATEDLTPFNLKGLDFALQYDSRVMRPTGSYVLGDVVTGGDLSIANVTINTEDLISTGVNKKAFISIHFSHEADPTTIFEGLGEVICVEFEFLNLNRSLEGKRSSIFALANFTGLGSVDEAYALNSQRACVEDEGESFVKVDSETLINGQVVFHDQLNIPVSNAHLNNEAATEIGTYNGRNCDVVAKSTVVNDDGSFELDVVGGSTAIRVDRQITDSYSSTNCVDNMDAINGMDTYLMELITTFDVTSQDQLISDGVTFVPGGNNEAFPTAYQMMAADVNINRQIRANDISWVAQRCVAKICEYPQAWNYTDVSGGLPVPEDLEKVSLDWRFVSDYEMNSFNDQFERSSRYPISSGVGYWRDRVPNRSLTCTDETGNITLVEVDSDIEVCNPYSNDVVIHGVLLGDLDGSWIQDKVLRSTGEDYVKIDLSNAINLNDGRVMVPVSFTGNMSRAVSVDFALDYNQSLVTISTVEKSDYSITKNLRLSHNVRKNDVLVSSYSMDGLAVDEVLHYIVMNDVDVRSDNFGSGTAYINGSKVPLEVEGSFSPLTAVSAVNAYATFMEAYPVPANNSITIKYSSLGVKASRMKVIDVTGRLMTENDLSEESGQLLVDVSEWSAGIYQIIWESNTGEFLSTERMLKE